MIGDQRSRLSQVQCLSGCVRNESRLRAFDLLDFANLLVVIVARVS